MRVVVSWSGGKDSCLAGFLAQQQGHELSYLLNMSSVEFKRSGGHGVALELTLRQSQVLGIPLIQGEFSAQDWGSYERNFKEALGQLKETGVGGVVTGDIHLSDSREWIARICAEVGLESLTPLWGIGVEAIINQFIDFGFEAIIVTTKADLMDSHWLGRKVDKSFVAALPDLTNKVDLCGERGEYHTFVFNGPLFQKRIEILKTDKVLRDGYWFLDIQRYEVVAK